MGKKEGWRGWMRKLKGGRSPAVTLLEEGGKKNGFERAYDVRSVIFLSVWAMSGCW